MDVVGEGHVLLDPKSALRSENTRSAAAEVGANENAIRDVSAQAPISPQWFLYHPRAPSVKSLALPWSAKEKKGVRFKIRQQPPTSLYRKRNSEGKFTDWG